MDSAVGLEVGAEVGTTGDPVGPTVGKAGDRVGMAIVGVAVGEGTGAVTVGIMVVNTGDWVGKAVGMTGVAVGEDVVGADVAIMGDMVGSVVIVLLLGAMVVVVVGMRLAVVAWIGCKEGKGDTDGGSVAMATTGIQDGRGVGVGPIVGSTVRIIMVLGETLWVLVVAREGRLVGTGLLLLLFVLVDMRVALGGKDETALGTTEG